MTPTLNPSQPTNLFDGFLMQPLEQLYDSLLHLYFLHQLLLSVVVRQLDPAATLSIRQAVRRDSKGLRCSLYGLHLDQENEESQE